MPTKGDNFRIWTEVSKEFVWVLTRDSQVNVFQYHRGVARNSDIIELSQHEGSVRRQHSECGGQIHDRFDALSCFVH